MPGAGRRRDDLTMLVMNGGRERTAPEFRDLLAAAGFASTAVVPVHPLSDLVEARQF